MISFLFFFTLKTEIVSAQDSTSFEKGLNGWEITGKVTIDHKNAYKGNACVKIEGFGSLKRRFKVSPLSLVQYKVYIKCVGKEAKGYSFIRFYDSSGRRVLQYQGKTISSAAYEETGYYTEAPPEARYLEIEINTDTTGKGCVYADDINTDLNIEGKAPDSPLCNLEQYMRPFWNSDTIFNETVLMLSKNGGKATSRLLYYPAKILSVKSYDLRTAYSAGTDYTINGNTITRTDHSRMPFKADSFFQNNDLAWYNIQSQWTVVTYIPTGRWKGPVPSYKGDKLPNTIARLHTKAPLRIVAYGMSITRGMNVSGYDKVPPYMPTYMELFVRQLRKIYSDNKITLYNAGLPGATVEWGARYAEKYVSPLRPDLVVIDFGMNDFWTVSPDQFREYVKTIMQKVKAGNPHAEFILLSNLKFDPDYVLDSDKNKERYLDNMNGYNVVLHGLEAGGVANLDMTTLSDIIYRLKKAKDCIVNPMHPNDYLARWYAQGLTALLDKTTR